METLQAETPTDIDPLSEVTVKGPAKDWSGIPKILAKYVIDQMNHYNSLVRFMKIKAEEESTSSLRAFIIDSLEKSNKQFSDYQLTNDLDI